VISLTGSFYQNCTSVGAEIQPFTIGLICNIFVCYIAPLLCCMVSHPICTSFSSLVLLSQFRHLFTTFCFSILLWFSLVFFVCLFLNFVVLSHSPCSLIHSVYRSLLWPVAMSFVTSDLVSLRSFFQYLSEISAQTITAILICCIMAQTLSGFLYAVLVKIFLF
jgi:hypothetical protein